MINKNIGLVIILVFFSSSVESQISIRQSMLADVEIQSGLSAYLKKIPLGHENYFGFTNRKELENVEFGEPLQIYTINYDSIEIESRTIKKSSLWYISLFVDTSYRCFLYVRQSNSSFKVVGIGLMEIAMELDNFEKLNHLKQMQNKALLIDQTSNLVCLVSENDTYYVIRSISNCTSCEKDLIQTFDRADFLSRITIVNKQHRLN